MSKIKVIFAAILTVAITVSVSAQTSSNIGGSERYNQHGDRIIDFFDVHAADLRSVVRQLSAYSGIDMVVSDAAKASVTLSVTNKSWRELLAIVCMVHNLMFVEEQTFIYVMTSAEAVARGVGRSSSGGDAAPGASKPLSPLGAIASTEILAPLVREVVPMRYITAQEMSGALSPFLTQRGKLTAIRHTNSIVLVDTEESLIQLKNLIDQIDIQTPQVSISCKILEVSVGDERNIGVEVGFADADNNITAGQFSKWTPGTPQFSADMHTLTYGVLDPGQLIAALNFLFEDRKAEVVAQPQITTLNNKEAKIFMGAQVSINTKDDAGNTITQLINVGTQLTVTPCVSGDGKIMLALQPSKESYQLTDQGPIINTQNATTNVLVNNGETVVIAGLTSNERVEVERGIPFLKDIPILGHLFKRSTKTTSKTDLMIFVTPHIIHPEI